MDRPPSLTVFDGSASIGGTKILFEQGSTRLFLDFGTNYQRMGAFYEEYLQPRPSRGITDYLAVGLLPRVKGVYRSDLFPPYDYPERDDDWPGSRVEAVLLSHGHLGHAGGIAFLDPELPIVATPMTLALLRAWQEGGRSDLTSEITYLGPRAPAAATGRAGDSLPGRRLESDRDAPRRSRRFWLVGGVPEGFAEELRRSPFGGRTDFAPIDPEPAPDRFGDVRVRFHGVDHSVYGAAGFLLEADGGAVAYSGDLRFHGERGRETEGFLTLLEAKHPEVLLVEGTRLRAPGDGKPQPRMTEDEVERNCRAEVARYEGRLVVADFGPRNVERLRRFRSIALASGRELVLTPKDAFLLHVLNAVDPRVEVDLRPGAMRILEEPSVGSERPWLSLVFRRFASAFLNPRDIARAPGRFLLCFSFFDANDLVDLKREGATEGGLWLYSSSEAHGEEQEFDFERLQRWIDWAGMHQVGFRYLVGSAGERTLSFDHPEDVGHHASGHATQEELVEFVRRVAPKFVVPVHTVQPPTRYAELLRARGALARVLRPEAGRPIDWSAG
ncbi:MAG TPA: MBL fold metallo-hydrolase [Thermoplasmata archaeon]|nr:MBL fold metallo-hydrolase [Thermoplasmata archaeon]